MKVDFADWNHLLCHLLGPLFSFHLIFFRLLCLHHCKDILYGSFHCYSTTNNFIHWKTFSFCFFFSSLVTFLYRWLRPTHTHNRNHSHSLLVSVLLVGVVNNMVNIMELSRTNQKINQKHCWMYIYRASRREKKIKFSPYTTTHSRAHTPFSHFDSANNTANTNHKHRVIHNDTNHNTTMDGGTQRKITVQTHEKKMLKMAQCSSSTFAILLYKPILLHQSERFVIRHSLSVVLSPVNGVSYNTQF